MGEFDHLRIAERRSDELQEEACRARLLRDARRAHRIVGSGRARPSEVRTRLGWMLVEVGLRLAAPATR